MDFALRHPELDTEFSALFAATRYEQGGHGVMTGPIASGAGVASQTPIALELPAREFAAAVAALPLVSVDWVLTNPDGELLLGRRINAPAQGWWFTPGGRIRKNEALAQALRRMACDELGLAPDLCERAWGQAQLMGAWDHFYADSAFSASVPTHYVNLPHWWPLSWADVALLKLPMGEQHSAWQWLPLADAAQSPLVHAYVRPYAAWVFGRDADANSIFDYS